MVTEEHVQAWLDAYVGAWRTYDPDRIGDLFTDDASYRYHPWDDPICGRDAIVADWLGAQDAPDTWEAEYYPLLIADNGVSVRGQTRYTAGKVFENLWLLEFGEDGRCKKFVEWFMVPPDSEV